MTSCIKKWGIAIGLFAGLWGTTVVAQVRLPNLFSDHGVLQRERPIHVWGWSGPSEKLSIRFHNQSVDTTADTIGRWSGWLMPEAAGGPFTLTVTGSSVVTVNDLLVGDVWLASGQSNMEMPMKGFGPTQPIKDSEKTLAQANLPQIRLLHIEKVSAEIPQTDFAAKWTSSTPETAANFSAVAFLFGKELYEREHVPIGLIDSSWGGTPIEAWISLEGLSSDSSLMPVFASRASFAEDQVAADIAAAQEKLQDEAATKAGLPKPVHGWHPNQSSWIPAALYNGMIAPLSGYSMKGAIWYQGESNASPERASLYAKLMPALITDWREKWQQGNFPFLYVQLTSYKPSDFWGTVRDAQRRSLTVTNTAMAVTLDVGSTEFIHPPDKPTVAARLALGARALAYGEAIEYCGPLYRQKTTQGGTIRIWFDHAAGLHAKGSTIEGFEIAGADGHFVPATAKIEGETVVVQATGVTQPRQVHYGWQGTTSANLFNGAGLPASTFGTE